MIWRTGLRPYSPFHSAKGGKPFQTNAKRFNSTEGPTIRSSSRLIKTPLPSLSRRLYSSPSSSTTFQVTAEVQNGIAGNEPVVALESAIITHGMPFPTNIETALRLQNIIREKGVIPATVGVIKGKLVVGLSDEEIEYLGSNTESGSGQKSRSMVKVSRRDLPFVMSQGLSGGTTVAGTIIGAARAGIPIFATGGIGGVHRGAEVTFDISTDLRELGRTPIAVVSAGIKSILDIGKTLEYLETEGVCVCVLRRKAHSSGERLKFPSFFTAESQFDAPFAVEDAEGAARLVESVLQFGLQSGLLIAVPIPEEFEGSSIAIERAIESALAKAAELGIVGKAMTPFLLGEINGLTRGESLKANQHLIENNVAAAADIALRLSKLRKEPGPSSSSSSSSSTSYSFRAQEAGTRNEIPCEGSGAKGRTAGRPVVIGGSNLDLILAVKEDNIVEDGRTHESRVRAVPGGVGRNMAEALQKLNQRPFLISAIGTDVFGQGLLAHFKSCDMDTEGLHISSGTESPTAIYSAVLTSAGECLFGLGDMTSHAHVTPALLDMHVERIQSASIVILDGNVPPETLSRAMEICHQSRVPVWFEPTEVRKARKLLEVPAEFRPALTYISPNWSELKSLTAGLDDPERSASRTGPEAQSILSSCFTHFPGLLIILLTQGSAGLTVVWRDEGSPAGFESKVCPPPQLEAGERVRSVSGAGDCLNAGFIAGRLAGLPLEDCLRKGTDCAKMSLMSHLNVPNSF